MKKALLVGINYVNSDIKLNGCINDIVNMETVLKTKYNYDHITMLRDDVTDPKLLPTHNNILVALRQIMLDSKDCSEIWIHYSGHGSKVRDFNGDEISGYDSVIVPSDYLSSGVIVDDDLYKIIQSSKCKTILLFDSCNSGTVMDLPYSYTLVTPNSYRRSLNNRYMLTNPQVYMFSGCKDNQTSADTYSLQWNQAIGAFTFAFLTCLKNANYQTSLLVLYRNVCVFLSKNGYSQLPVYSSSSSNPTASTASLILPPRIPILLKSMLTTVITNTHTHTNNIVTKKTISKKIPMRIAFIQIE